MAISDTQKVDLLYKKYFGVTKTDLATNKSPSNEAIASPALSRIDQLWTQAASIPGTAAATAGIVQAYTGASAVQCTADTTTTPISSVYPSWKTNLTDWIPSEFGSTYFVQVWVDSSGVGNPTATGTQIFDSGSGGTGEWNFDYKAGVLNFIGGTIPAVLTASKVIYIVGYRYIGLKATNFGNATIGNINISGNTITGNSSGITFGSNIYVGNIFYSNGSPFISGGGSSFGNADVLANLAANSAANITVFGNITGTYFVGNAFYLTGLAASYSNLNVASYLLTNTGNISAGNILVQNRVYANTITSNGGNVVTVSGTGALGLPVGSTGQRPISSSTGYIRYNTDESTVEYFNGTDWTPVTNVVIDQAIVGDGTTKTFTLTQSATAIGLLVSINGVIQNPNTGSYSVVGNQITFAEAPLSTDSVDIRFIASLTSVPGTISNDLTIYGNLTVSGNIVSNTGIYTYGNVQVAQYLAANPQTGTYSNVNVAAYLSANPQGGSTYSNTNVAAYLTTQTFYSNSNVAAYLIANPQGGIYSNTNVAAYLTTQTFYSNTNVAAYLSTASITASSIANGGSSLSFTGSGGNAVFQIGAVQTMTFGQTLTSMIGSISATANVSGVNFLGNVIGNSVGTTATYSGNVTAGNISATQYGNSFGTTATYSGNVTAANVNATVFAPAVNINSTTGNYNVLNISGAALAPYGSPQTWRFFTNNTSLGSVGSWIVFPDLTLQTTGYPGVLVGGVPTLSIGGNLTTGSYINAVTGNIVGNLTAGNLIGNQYGNSIGTTAAYSGNVTAGNIIGNQYGNSIGTTATYTGNVYAGNIIATQWGNTVLSSTQIITSVPGTNANVNIDPDGNGGVNIIGNTAITGNLTVNGQLIQSVAASYTKYTRTTTQGSISANTVIVCNTLENTAGTDIAVNTSTGQYTLTAGRTYRLRGMVPGWTGSSGSLSYAWYNETTSAWIGEAGETYSGSSGAAYGGTGGSAEAVITVASTTVVSFRVLSASGVSSLGGNTDFNNGGSPVGSYPWTDIQVIGGAAPLTGTNTSNITPSSGNLTVTGNLVTTGYGFFPGAFQESSTLSGVFVGNTGSAGGQTPRIAFYNGNVSQNWQIDNFNGALRFFTPGVTRASIDGNTNQLSVYGNVSTTGQLLSFMGTANSDNQLVLQGNVWRGGAGYHDFLRVTSTYSSVTNPNKFFRLNSTGGLEIVNSAYNATIFTMTDGGDTTIAGNLTVNGINSGYAPNRPAFRVYGNSNTGWTSSSPTSGILTSGQFSVDFNQGSYLNTSTGVFTAPVAGLYQVNLTARTNSNNNGAGSAIQVQKNGSSIVYLEWAANTSTNHIGGGTVIKLAVGDTLRVVVSSGTVNFDTNDSWSVAYLG